jgi:hypothetical protein
VNGADASASTGCAGRAVAAAAGRVSAGRVNGAVCGDGARAGIGVALRGSECDFNCGVSAGIGKLNLPGPIADNPSARSLRSQSRNRFRDVSSSMEFRISYECRNARTTSAKRRLLQSGSSKIFDRYFCCENENSPVTHPHRDANIFFSCGANLLLDLCLNFATIVFVEATPARNGGCHGFPSHTVAGRGGFLL